MHVGNDNTPIWWISKYLCLSNQMKYWAHTDECKLTLTPTKEPIVYIYGTSFQTSLATWSAERLVWVHYYSFLKDNYCHSIILDSSIHCLAYKILENSSHKPGWHLNIVCLSQIFNLSSYKTEKPSDICIVEAETSEYFADLLDWLSKLLLSINSYQRKTP